MKFRKFLLLPLVLVPVAIISCSHAKVDKDIDQKAAKESYTPTDGALAAKGYEIIQNAPNLNADQKQKLLDLQKKMSGKMAALRKEESKLKSILFRSIVDAKYDAQEVDRLQSRLVSLDKKKMNMMFSALKETKKILGRTMPEDEKLYRMVDRIRISDREE